VRLQVDYVDDAYGEYYPMAAGFEVEAADDDEILGKKKGPGTEEAHDAASEKAKADALSARQQASKLQSQLQKIENIMIRKGQDHKEAFARPPKVGWRQCRSWVLSRDSYSPHIVDCVLL